MKDKLKSSEVEKLKSSRPFNLSTGEAQPFNHSTIQPFNLILQVIYEQTTVYRTVIERNAVPVLEVDLSCEIRIAGD